MITYSTYAATLELLTAQAWRALLPLFRQFLRTDKGFEARAELVGSVLPTLLKYRQRARDEAVRLVHSEAERVGIKVPEADLPGVREYSDEVLNVAVNRLFHNPSLASYQEVVRRHVESAAHTFMDDFADPAPWDDDAVFVGDEDVLDFLDDLSRVDGSRIDVESVMEFVSTEDVDEAVQTVRDSMDSGDRVNRRRYKYARLLTGNDNCAFCVMLATRGAVYSSKRRAGGLDSDRYHPSCDCKAVPVFVDEQRNTDVERRLRAIWQAAQSALDTATAEGTKNDALNNLRHYLNSKKVSLPDLEEADI